MSWISVPPLIMSALSLYVGLNHLWLYLRRRDDRTHLSFAVTCITIAVYDVFSAGLYQARSVEEGISWQRLQFVSLAVFSMAFASFLLDFINRRYLKLRSAVFVWFAILLLLGLTVSGELTLTIDRPHPKSVLLPWGLMITYREAMPGLIYTIQYLSMTALAVFVFVIIWRSRARSGRDRMRPLLISLFFFFAACINDALVGMGFYSFIYLMEYAYMAIILLMAYSLQKTLLTLQSEVESLNRNLEARVNQRTVDLLMSEIGAKLYAEMLGEMTGASVGDKRSDDLSKNFSTASLASIVNLSQDVAIISHQGVLAHRALARAVSLGAASCGHIFLVDESGRPALFASHDPDSGSEPSLSLLSYYQSVVDKVFESGKSVALEAQTQGGIKGTAASPAVLCVPIASPQRTLGVLYLERWDGSGFPAQTTVLIGEFITLTAIAFENAFAYRDLSGSKVRSSRVTEGTEAKVREAMEYIEQNYRYDISREGLAASLGINPDFLGKSFLSFTGKKIGDYINELRIREAESLLGSTDRSIIEIAFSVGFESLRTFNRAFKKIHEISPQQFRAEKRPPR